MNDPVQRRFEALFGPEFGHGQAFDLNLLRGALDALGAPQLKLPPVIHVAGTNGKGSTIAFMSAIVEAAGLKIHAFTKPHLFQLNERFVVSSRFADDRALLEAAEDVARVAPRLTQFDAQVAAALLLFREHEAALALIETGMGGRDDSTNVIGAPAASVITPIGLDHQDALGDTLAEIAAHKAGILKPNAPAIVARQAPEAMAVIEARAAEIEAPLYRCGAEWMRMRATVGLWCRPKHGRLICRFQLCKDSIKSTMRASRARRCCFRAPRNLMNLHAPQVLLAHRGRRAFSRSRRGPFSASIRAIGGEVWVDGGHNAHAAQALSRALEQMKMRRGGTSVAIVGLRKRKDALSFIAAIAAGAEHIIAVPLAEDHVSLHEMAALGDKLGRAVATAPSLEAAMQDAAQLPAPRVLICGSFLLAAEALALESAGEGAGAPS